MPRLHIPLLLFLVCILVSGCSHQTTISEASTYLQAKALEVEITSYKNQLQLTKKRLVEVIPEFQEVTPLPPTARVGELANFLENNDCEKVENKKYCYQLTRYRLIQVTQMLDEASAENWAAKLTIRQLQDNVSVIIDGLGQREKEVTAPKQ